MKSKEERQVDKNGYLMLPTEFSELGWGFVQICRKGDIAIYKKTKKGVSFPNWEVVIVNRHDGYEIAGNKIPPSEIYPKSEDWGIYGWTINNETAAYKKLEELNKTYVKS